MSETNPYPSAIARTGLDAMRAGDNGTSLAKLNEAFEAGDRHPDLLLGLCFVARAEKEFQTAHDAADLFLRTDPEHIHANIIKGDALAGLGDRRSAINFYAAALRSAPPPEEMPKSLANELYRAQADYKKYQDEFTDKMNSRLSELGLTSGGERRLEQAVDILLGKRQAFLQQPTKFFMPGLPNIQFFNTSNFAWASKLASRGDEIRAELAGVLTRDKALEPYVAHNAIAPVMGDHGLHQNAQWSSYHLYRDGEANPEHIARCPVTMDIVSQAPNAKIPGRSPNILFSILEPGAHIPPHHGQMNTRLLCHLPLVVPDGCELRVGNITRKVRQNEVLIFDDSIEHEARNTSDQRRAVLIFDIWRPELLDDEKEKIAQIFETLEEIK